MSPLLPANDHDAGAAPSADAPAPAAPAPAGASATATPSPRILRERLDPNEILITICLLGEVTKQQLLGIHFPSSPLRRIERTLSPLMRQGLIERRARYLFDVQRQIPIPLEHAYRLSAYGHEVVAHDPRYPVQTGTDEYRVRLPSVETNQVLEHDLMGTEALSWLIVLARGRSSLSGMFLRREQQLDPQARAPRIDSVLVLHYGGPPVMSGGFVWTKNPPADCENHWPIALEIDRNTEAISIVRSKALRYCEALERERTYTYWQTHYGRVPLIMWIAPTERRLAAIHRVWYEAWPEGSWALATIDSLSRGYSLFYDGDDDTVSRVRVFSGSGHTFGTSVHTWPAEGGVIMPIRPPSYRHASTPPAQRDDPPRSVQPHPLPATDPGHEVEAQKQYPSLASDPDDEPEAQEQYPSLASESEHEAEAQEQYPSLAIESEHEAEVVGPHPALASEPDHQVEAPQPLPPRDVWAMLDRDAPADWLWPTSPRWIDIEFDDLAEPAEGRVPVCNIPIEVRARDAPSFWWEGRLWHPSAAPCRLDLGIGFARQALEIWLPTCDHRCELDAHTDTLHLAIAWPTVAAYGWRSSHQEPTPTSTPSEGEE